MMLMTVRCKNQRKLWAKGHTGHEGSGKGLEHSSERSNQNKFHLENIILKANSLKACKNEDLSLKKDYEKTHMLL